MEHFITIRREWFLYTTRYEASDVPLTEWMVISADYARGSSGAAVLNDFGEVVGMVASTVTIHYEKQKMTNPQMVLRLCAPINAIRKLIE